MTKDTKCEQCGAYRYSNIPAAPTAPQPTAGEAPQIPKTRFGGRHGIPFYLQPGQEAPEYDQGDSVIVWYDDLYNLAHQRAASISGEAEPQRLDSRAHLGDGDGAARELAEPTYRALKDEAGHWMAETKRLRLENDADARMIEDQIACNAELNKQIAALADENAALKEQIADLNEHIKVNAEVGTRRAAELVEAILERDTAQRAASGTAETIQLARRPEP